MRDGVDQKGSFLSMVTRITICIHKESLSNHKLADSRGKLGITTHSAPAFCVTSIDFKSLILASWKALM